MHSTKSIIATGLILTALAGCGQQMQEKYPHTGSADYEMMVSASIDSRELVEEGRVYHITTNGLNIRSSDSISNNIVGRLMRNDRVRVVNSSENFNDNFVQVEVVATRQEIQPAERYFISFAFMSERPADNRDFNGRYFMVENIATERVRVYERLCPDYSCSHRMVMEAPMVAGEDKNGDRSYVGSFRISDWRKFYQDHARNYPSWYDPTFPDVPPPGRGFRSWLSSSLMPEINGRRHGVMRGAFGWYTALVEPNANGRWTHGTVGWGADKQEFIDKTKRFLPNLITSPRSSGCTRVDNETVAFLRHLLPVGTPIIRIYAIEQLADPSRREYSPVPTSWDYILTTRGVRVNGQTADRAEVLASGIQSHEIIEEGIYTVNQYPTPVEFEDGLGRFRRRVGERGNVYGVDGSEMRGVFYVDKGILEGYQHPRQLTVGGFRDEVTPSWMDANQVPFTRHFR